MITIEESFLEKGHVGYKVSNYKEFNRLDVYNSSFNKSSNWSGIYIATTIKVAAGYRYDDKHMYAHSVYLMHNLKMIICRGCELGSPHISDDKKAKMIIDRLPHNLKEAINTKKKPLIPALGELGFCYQGPHDEEEGIEIIIPERLAMFVFMDKRLDYRPRRF